MESYHSVEILKAMSDETRLGIVRKLAALSEPVASCDIVRSCALLLKLSQPAMSHHFSKLADAGVIVVEKRGTQKLYRLNTELLTSIGIDATKL